MPDTTQEQSQNDADNIVLQISGADRNGQQLVLKNRKSILGSHESCTVKLNSPTVQPVHCMIINGKKGTIVRNFHADTRINGHAFQDQWLEAGDAISVGSVDLTRQHQFGAHAVANEINSPSQATANAEELLDLVERFSSMEAVVEDLRKSNRRSYRRTKEILKDIRSQVGDSEEKISSKLDVVAKAEHSIVSLLQEWQQPRYDSATEDNIQEVSDSSTRSNFDVLTEDASREFDKTSELPDHSPAPSNDLMEEINTLHAQVELPDPQPETDSINAMESFESLPEESKNHFMSIQDQIEAELKSNEPEDNIHSDVSELTRLSDADNENPADSTESSLADDILANSAISDLVYEFTNEFPEDSNESSKSLDFEFDFEMAESSLSGAFANLQSQEISDSQQNESEQETEGHTPETGPTPWSDPAVTEALPGNTEDQQSKVSGNESSPLSATADNASEEDPEKTLGLSTPMLFKKLAEDDPNLANDPTSEMDADREIHDYMQQLLGKTEDEASDSSNDAEKRASEEEKYEKLEPETFIPRSAVPERADNLQAMRKLANESARSAIESSSRRRHFERQATLSLVATGLFFFLGASSAMFIESIFSMPFFTSAFAFTMTGICALHYIGLKNRSGSSYPSHEESFEISSNVETILRNPANHFPRR
ncbi:MAG: hypothetical protein P8M80_16195 [Pirellulaceae bacterium]|nr:hypothetical protein [Pirellulaceae bacterium]